MNKSFTLIELLIVIAIIAILATAIIMVISPGERLTQTRDVTRERHLYSLQQAVLFYQIDNLGSLPETITQFLTEICHPDLTEVQCNEQGLVFLKDLVPNHIATLPIDPQGGIHENGIGYFIFQENGNIGIVSMRAETRPITIGARTSSIMVWDTTKSGVSENNEIALPLESSGNYNFTVTGDNLIGSPRTITSYTDNILEFSTTGEQTITISGTIEGWRFNNEGDKLKIMEILQWGSLKLGNNNGYFYGCENLDLSNVSDVLDLSGTTDMRDIFRDCSSLITVNHMNEWDVSSVTNMERMFYSATLFNQNISGWNVSGVTTMRRMFNSARAFDQDISNWNTSSVTNMKMMFSDARVFDQDISNWNTSSVINMYWMFQGTFEFNQDIGNWDVSKVTNMGAMFYLASNFDQDISNWNVSNVDNFEWNSEGFIQGIQLSTSNYDKLLIEWSKLSLNSNLDFHGGNSEFSSEAQSSRNNTLINNFNWNIIDGCGEGVQDACAN